MSWFWKSKTANRKAEPTDLQASQAEIALFESDDVQTASTQSKRPSSSTPANPKNKLTQAEVDQMIADERMQHSQVISELNSKLEDLDSSINAEQQKVALLDEANVTMAEMLKGRDQQIEDLQKASASELQVRDLKIQQMEQQLRDLGSEIAAILARNGSEIAAISARNESQIADLARQLAIANEQSTARIRDLEQRAATDSAEAEARIAHLNQQLSESEARSNQRAEQRSALLRNMTEIHRLSTVASKTDAPPNSLKITNSMSSEASQNASTKPNSSWVVYGESESA